MKQAKRIAEPGKRHRRDNGPAALEVQEAPELTQKQLGTTTDYVQQLVGEGPEALKQAHHEANKLAAKFGTEFEAKWLLETEWLRRLSSGDGARAYYEHRTSTLQSLNRLIASHRAQARYSLIWRPRYLAALALTRSPIIAAKAAKVAYNTAAQQRRDDPDFASQCEAAEDHAVQLLHDACFASALEGDCEPVFWQGIRVGYVRKYDSRLRIEMLRAHLPHRFKAPGQANVKVLAGNGAQVLVIGEAERDELVSLRQQALKRIVDARVVPAAVEASSMLG